MHNLVNDVILGIVEGLTEFLPVSSTAHLLIVQDLLGFVPPGEVFPIVIQFGAILAVVAIYWRRFWDVLVTLPTSRDSRRFALGVVLAFLPAAVFGAALHGFIKNILFAPDIAPKVIATTLIMGGILILIFERLAPPPRHMDGDKLPLATMFWIGVFQILAIIPGVSRSGATIIGGILMGLERPAAAEFSFFLAMPTLTAAFAHSALELRHQITPDRLTTIAVGFVTAFIASLLVVQPFLSIVRRRGFAPFAWYRIVVGAALLAAVQWGYL